MNIHDATEQAYRNGYEAGFKKAENIYLDEDKEKLSKKENKIWMLLDEDLKTPYFSDISGQNQESNKVMPLIVAAKTREEAIKFFKLAPVKKNATILEPMVVEADVYFKPAKIIYD